MNLSSLSVAVPTSFRLPVSVPVSSPSPIPPQPPPFNPLVITLSPIMNLPSATSAPTLRIIPLSAASISKPTTTRRSKYAPQQPAQDSQHAASPLQCRRDVPCRALYAIFVGPRDAPATAHIPPPTARGAICKVA